MFAIDKFKFTVEKEEDNFGKYSFGPLPMGYGMTIGNALRRILLSSIKGAAITSVKVEGVKHEYSTIDGVADDVLTILLRLKQLAVKCYSDEPQEIELKVKGKKIVTAKDLKLTSDVEIINPDFVITELTDSKAKLDMTIIVEQGAGYIPSDEAKRGQIGIIPLDANFAPVKRVIQKISKTRVGQQTDLDQIDMEIYTNGVVSARDALNEALKIYHTVTKRLLVTISGEEEEEEPVKAVTKKEEKSQSSDLDIDKLNLSTRLTNSLLKSGYKNLTELEGMTTDEIMEIRGLGQRSAEELIDIMRSYKLNIKDSE